MKANFNQKICEVCERGILFYQKYISPHLGRHCRFQPSCSEYALLAIRKRGVLRGAALSVLRLLRCNPLCACGRDIP